MDWTGTGKRLLCYFKATPIGIILLVSGSLPSPKYYQLLKPLCTFYLILIELVDTLMLMYFTTSW